MTVNVLNGTGVAGQARDVDQALTAVGFQRRTGRQRGDRADDRITYAPGSEQAADLLARHLTTTTATTVADPTLAANHLTLVTGADFSTVMQTPRPPASTTTTSAPPPDVATRADHDRADEIGITPGQAPPGVSC